VLGLAIVKVSKESGSAYLVQASEAAHTIVQLPHIILSILLMVQK